MSLNLNFGNLHLGDYAMRQDGGGIAGVDSANGWECLVFAIL